MREQNIYTTINFRNKNNHELMRQLTVRNHPRSQENIRKTIEELTEKYCLPEQDILIETN